MAFNNWCVDGTGASFLVVQALQVNTYEILEEKN